MADKPTDPVIPQLTPTEQAICDAVTSWWRARLAAEGKVAPTDVARCLLSCARSYQLDMALIEEKKREIEALLAQAKETRH